MGTQKRRWRMYYCTTVCTVVPAPTLTAPPSVIDEPISILEDPC